MEKATVTFAPAGSLQAFDTPNCDAWLIEGNLAFDDFIALYDEKSAQNLGYHILSSFDDYGQACYTSGHAMQRFDLDPPYEDGAPELSCREKFAAIYSKFMALTGGCTFASLAGRLCWSQTDDINIVSLNGDPADVLDTTIVMQIVPVTVPEESLAAFPNGYFADDLKPFENHALAAHMRLHHGYNLMAIGASYICLLRDTPIDAQNAQAAAAAIASLYNDIDQSSAASDLAAIITGKRYVILTYANL